MKYSLACALLLLFVTGCQETTIHLKSDGSGTMETLAVLRRSDLANNDEYKKDAKVYETETIKALTEGASLPVNTRGLSVASITPVTNEREFGVKVAYTFNSIEAVEVSACSLWLNDKSTDPTKYNSSALRFTLERKDDGGKLKIRLPADACGEKFLKSRTLAQELLQAVSGSQESAGESLMRSGVSIKIDFDGSISKTNALHVSNDTITVFEFKDPTAQDISLLQSAQSQGSDKKKDAESLLKSLQGLKMNLSPEIEVKWKTAGR